MTLPGRAIKPVLSPARPALAIIYPFAAGNPLTPVIQPDFASGDVDPDLGILVRPATALVLYQLDPAVARPLLAIIDQARATVELRFGP